MVDFATLAQLSFFFFVFGCVDLWMNELVQNICYGHEDINTKINKSQRNKNTVYMCIQSCPAPF